MKFYLGTCAPKWLEFSKIPLFISYRTLRNRKSFLKKAKCRWALDSGGFSELSIHGKWTITPEEYVQGIKLYESQLGKLDFCAIQDYMCEPFILQKTGLSIEKHQELTCQSYFDLKSLNPGTNFLPILQGWKLDDYLRHIELYQKLGIELSEFTQVGVGSVCKRQSSDEIGQIMMRLHSEGIKIHGFGVKVIGLRKYKDYIASADSMVWSWITQHTPALEGCTHKRCTHCYKFAYQWYKKSIDPIINPPKPRPPLKQLKSIIKYRR